jgi:hypothetical protein
MSDKPEGPGWWLATDGKWYPPELHPSVRDGSPAAPTQESAAEGHAGVPPVDRRSPVQPAEGSAPRRWQGQADRRQSTRQFPDLFQKAMQGSHLADNISVVYDDDRPSGPDPTSRSNDRSSPEPASVAGGVSGATIGAPPPTTKRRWRKGH